MSSFFVELNDFETVQVSGPDAAKFLQGQLTCDVHALAENAFTYGAACNNKGRIFAAFILARHGSDFHVLLAHGLAKIFISNLQKFIPFYKCSMQILSAQKALGLTGIKAVGALKKCLPEIPAPGTCGAVPGMWVYNLLGDNTQFILSINETEWPSIKAGILSYLPEASAAHWELKNIFSGHFPFGLEDVDKYTPQELHFDQTGYISFSKGCYTGQEIIARMHYRGKAKKQLYLLQIAKFRSSPDHSRIEIFDDSEKTLGFAMKPIIDDNQTLFAIASLPIELGSVSLFTEDKQIFVHRPLITASS